MDRCVAIGAFRMMSFLLVLGVAAMPAPPADAGARVALPTGACCNSPNGCCEVEGGNCFETTAPMCAIGFQGEGTSCAVLCPTATTTTTTTTTLPVGGACCLSEGGCMDLSEKNCGGVGAYQGDGLDCNEVLCVLPTTTTTLDAATTTTTLAPVTTTTTLAPGTTTTTLLPPLLCGDANGDGDITAADALVALKTSVGTLMCAPQQCDYNGSGEVTVADALLILKVAVGQVIVPMCPLVEP